MLHVRLHGEEYVMESAEGGFIAKSEAYQHGEEGYAHAYPDGTVRRYGEVIARLDEVEVLGEIGDLEPAEDFWENFNRPWPGEQR